MVSILKRIPNVQYEILRDFNKMMLSESTDCITQNDIAEKYGTAQSTISRILRYTSLQQLAIIKDCLNHGKSFEDIAKAYPKIYDSADHVKMSAIYGSYHAYGMEDGYINMIKELGLIKFARDLVGTRANKYGRVIHVKGGE